MRVNDVTFLKGMENGSQVLHILEIDIGIRSIVRRVLSGIVPAGIDSFAAAAHSSAFDSLGILQHCGGRSAAARALNISNKLLEDMHPADLADIVEHLGHEDRTAIINAVDTETAAEMLSEVEPEIQTSIIESLEAEKAADILEEMEPSEAADVLNEIGSKSNLNRFWTRWSRRRKRTSRNCSNSGITRQAG